MQVVIPSQLQDYTGGAASVEAAGADLAQVLADLDQRYPGIRFRVVDEQDRIRPHIRIFIDQSQARSLDVRVEPRSKVLIFGALSGG